MNLVDSRHCYLEHVATLKSRLDSDSALRTAIGGEFIAMGTLEHELLRSLGLRDGDFVVDVGCGSGRLAYQLSRYEKLRYVGIDVVPDLLRYAARIASRRDWRFDLTDGRSIPVDAATADFVCLFSVVTHLPLENSFQYLAEAQRVLRPNGRVVLSFLEFRIPCHWEQFQLSPRHTNATQHLNQFIDRETITLWAARLGFDVELFADGDRPHIPLSQEVHFESGLVMREHGNLGQSVAVLRKHSDARRTGIAAAVPGTPEPPRRPVHETPEPHAAVPAPLVSVSARGYVRGGDDALILGFTVPRNGQTVRICMMGPGLAAYGVDEWLARPQVTIHDRSGRTIVDSEALVGSSASTCPLGVIGAVSKSASAPWDFTLLVTLPAGVFTAVVHDVSGVSGNALAEISAVE